MPEEKKAENKTAEQKPQGPNIREIMMDYDKAIAFMANTPEN